MRTAWVVVFVGDARVVHGERAERAVLAPRAAAARVRAVHAHVAEVRVPHVAAGRGTGRRPRA